MREGRLEPESIIYMIQDDHVYYASIVAIMSLIHLRRVFSVVPCGISVTASEDPVVAGVEELVDGVAVALEAGSDVVDAVVSYVSLVSLVSSAVALTSASFVAFGALDDLTEVTMVVGVEDLAADETLGDEAEDEPVVDPEVDPEEEVDDPSQVKTDGPGAV